MTNERSYPKAPDGGKPAPVGGDTPTVNVAAEVAARKQAAEQAVAQADQAGPRAMWTMPKPQAEVEAPQPPAEDVERTQRLLFGSASQSAPVHPVQPAPSNAAHPTAIPARAVQTEVTGQASQTSADSVIETQRMPFPAQTQSGPAPQASNVPQQSVDQTQRLPFPALSQANPPAAPPQSRPQSGPVVQEPDRTQAYAVEETARSQPHNRAQYQPQAQPQPQAQGRGYGAPTPPHAPAPTPTLRFDEMQAVGDDQPLNPGEYRHFGPGVPEQSGTPAQAAAVWRGEAAAPPQGRPKRRRAFAGWLLALAVLGIVLGILGYLYYFGPPVKVTGATVKGPASALTCGQSATITGTLETNGDACTVTYQWKRSDGTKSDVLTQHFNKGTRQADVALLWTFNGTGTLKATATLDVISPDPTTASVTFDYTCTH